MKEKPVACIIIPAFNEQSVLPESLERISILLENLIQSDHISHKSYICIVDDGSRDGTWQIVTDRAKRSPRITGIKLSSNFGHQHALMAGLESCVADIFITIDADLQDDETAIIEMVNHYLDGAHIVYGIRKSRNSATLFKRFSALTFYKVMDLFKTGTIYNHADFRLLSSDVVQELRRFKEVNLFLRAIIPSIGFRQSQVYYDRKERAAGESKYPLVKMLSFAWNGITSFTTIPLKMVSFLGMVIFLMTLLGASYSIWQKVNGNVIPGWTSTVLPIFFLGGVQLLCTGILGEYIGKIYQEIKRRPRFIIEKKTDSYDSDPEFPG